MDLPGHWPKISFAINSKLKPTLKPSKSTPQEKVNTDDFINTVNPTLKKKTAAEEEASSLQTESVETTSLVPQLPPAPTPNPLEQDYTKKKEDHEGSTTSARDSEAFLPNAIVTATALSSTSYQPRSGQPVRSMAEPPAKRIKRTDSSAMWDRNSRSSRPADSDQKARSSKDTISTRDKRDDRERYHGREDRRHRSRSRDRNDRRRDPSRSRDRDGGRHRDGERGAKQDRRERDRSISRERHRSRRDDPPPSRRSDRHRTRSRSPALRHAPPSTRTRSPPKAQTTKPSLSNPTTKAPTLSNPTTRPPPPLTPTNKHLQKSDPPAKSLTKPASSTPPPQMDGASAPATEMDIDSDPEVALMRQTMGFTGFKTTKNTKVAGNDIYGVRKEKKTEYRQYMNRVGGFNRPLSPSR